MKKNYKKEYKLYKNVNNNYISIGNYNSKHILMKNPKLIITYNNKEIYKLENIQSLYLYPLTVLDYIKNIDKKRIISTSIINIDCDFDYIEILSNDIFKNLKTLEIVIKEEYTIDEFNKISCLIDYLVTRDIDICLNIKDLCILPDSFKEYFKHISYFKIFLSNKIDLNQYNTFYNKLKLINKYSLENSLIHIKSYLNINQADNYGKMIEAFSKYNVDIFQISKELIPLGGKNVKVDENTQETIRNLESKYSNYKSTKFISVKDISTLYYPRFELDERNSRNCYACSMKPYLFRNMIIPCKVMKIFDEIDKWGTDYTNINKYNEIVDKCGKKCDDCASIFENDLLSDVDDIIHTYNNINVYLVEDYYD